MYHCERLADHLLCQALCRKFCPESSGIRTFGRNIPMTSSRQFQRARLPLIAAACFLLSGCVDSSNSGKKASVATPDDPKAIAALEAAGCRLTKNAAGLVTEISVSADTDFSKTLKHLAGTPNITSARFGGPGMNDEGMASIVSLKLLKRLDLTDCSAIGDDTLKVVGDMPSIDVLILRRVGFSDAGLASVSKLAKLRALDLRNTNVTDAGIQHLEGLTKLVDLQLENSKITDAGIEYLRGMPLKSLNLNYDTSITDAAMPAIASISTLESLQMDATRLTDVGMAELSKLKRLKRFGCRQADISGEGIQHLAGLKELTRLELRETSIDDSSLEIISQFPKLTFLDVSECRSIKGKTLGELGKLTGLTYLELREVKKVNDDNFAALGTLTNLTELNLEATRITDASTPTLLKMQKLERLSVAGSQMGDEGILQLGQLPALKWLNLQNSRPLPETVAALKAARPGITIVE